MVSGLGLDNANDNRAAADTARHHERHYRRLRFIILFGVQMAKKKVEQVSECIQCMGDELLEVRNDASQFHQIQGVLSQAFPCKRHKPGTTVLQYVNALLETHVQYEKALHSRRSNVERKVREAEDLIAALRFISQACKCSSGGVTVGGAALTVGMDQLLSVVIGRVQSLVSGDKGLLDGYQSHAEVDPLAAIWQD